jgi:predicted DNA-binding protein
MRIQRTPKVRVARTPKVRLRATLKQISWRMTLEMCNNLKELAKKSNLTFSEYVRNILDKSV